MTTTCLCDSGVTIYKKRDRTISFKIAGLGTLLDAKIWFSVKEDKDLPDSEAVITKKSANNGGSDAQAKVTIVYAKETDEESQFYNQWIGVVEVYIVPDDTASLDEGIYFYDLVIEISSGRKLQVLNPAQFKIELPVTNT